MEVGLIGQLGLIVVEAVALELNLVEENVIIPDHLVEVHLAQEFRWSYNCVMILNVHLVSVNFQFAAI